jgi:hypothetical protein
VKRVKAFEIILRESTTKRFARVVIERLTFPEAVQAAYNLKHKKGLAWSIESVVKMGREL